MKVAVAGCCHGALDKMYETLELLQQRHNVRPDLLLCCGDFQAVRNEADLRCMAVPAKYRHMQTFYRYYSGEKKAPVLTVFIGGNHEASNHLQELPYGGWVAPNIYYLGYAGVVRFRGVRIGGISGIFKSHDYRKGHFECPPYNQQTIRSAYHVRNIEVFKLKQLKRPMDIFMSHDWPRSIYHYGNKKQLLKMKSFFRQEVESNTLGSPAASELLQHLKPTYWFSAHLHVKFAAFMQHQIIDIEHDPSAGDSLEYDAEWIAVLKATNSLINVTQSSWNMPEKNGLHAKWDYSVTEEAIKEVLEELNHNLKIPCNFTLTAACYDPSKPQKHMEPVHSINPQTTEFCAQFGLTDINDRIQQAKEEGSVRGEYEEEEEEEEMDSTGSAEEPSEYNTDNSGLSSINPDEIMLDEEGGDEDLSTCSVDPSPDHPPDFSASFSDIRIMPDSMAVSSDDAMDSTNEELEKSGVSKQVEEKSLSERPLKRIGGNENGNSGIKKIKRRNQAIYAAEDEDKTE
uniref:Debranching RNA lariats 1 n=1 Tax=Aquila chrysaetos chrysaetos TaxID=223781 RepID=A0A663E488_AQUCH